MSFVGYQTTPSFGFFSEGNNTGNLIGALFVMPTPGGLVTAIHAYAATFTGTATPVLCIWDGFGTLLGSAAASASVSASSPTWVGGTLATPVFIAGGQSFFLGWINPTANGFYAEYNSVGGASLNWSEQSTIPGNIGSHTNITNEQIGVYADYTPSEAFVNTGTSGSPAWTAGAVYVWNGSSWVVATPQVFNGSSWVNGA